MVTVDLSKHSDSDNEQIIDDEELKVGSEIIEPTSLKIQNSGGEIIEVSKKQERYRRKTMKRLIGKNGRHRLRAVGLKRMRKERLKDGFTTFLEWSWSYTLLIFTDSFFFSWVFFAFF